MEKEAILLFKKQQVDYQKGGASLYRPVKDCVLFLNSFSLANCVFQRDSDGGTAIYI